MIHSTFPQMANTHFTEWKQFFSFLFKQLVLLLEVEEIFSLIFR